MSLVLKGASDGMERLSGGYGERRRGIGVSEGCWRPRDLPEGLAIHVMFTDPTCY